MDLMQPITQISLNWIDFSNEIGTSVYRIYPHSKPNRRVRWRLDLGFIHSNQENDFNTGISQDYTSKLRGFHIRFSKGREYIIRRKPGREMMLVFDFPIGCSMDRYHSFSRGKQLSKINGLNISAGVTPALGFAVHKNPKRPYLRIELGININYIYFSENSHYYSQTPTIKTFDWFITNNHGVNFKLLFLLPN